MKKIKNLLLIFILLITLSFTTSCSESEKISIITPSGTPSLIASKTILEYKNLVDYQIVKGSDSLTAAFTRQDKDIIIAPVNLGAKFANSVENFPYVMYHTIVWCNYYIVSTEPIESFVSLNQKEITVFGKNSTPDVIFSTLVKYHNIVPKVDYVNDVATANSMLLAGKSTIIISAEPALSVLLTKGEYYTYSLADAWSQMTSSPLDVPQAAIFVKKDKLESQTVKNILASITYNTKNYERIKTSIVTSAKEIDANLSNDSLIYEAALSRCNYKIDEQERTSIEYYFEQVIALGLGKTIGGKLPSEEFYIQK